MDDSIVRVMMGRELVLRRARGYAPLPIQLSSSICHLPSVIGHSVLAVGAHLKNTVALSVGPQVFISQHIGDLETDQSFNAFRRVIADFQNLYESRPTLIAADAHPDYLSTQYARDLQVGQASRLPLETKPSSMPSEPDGPQGRRDACPTLLISVQHHVAHVLSCMAENELEPPVLGVSWDGTGYGLDGTVWGGEFFLVTETSCERVAHLRPFRLPGGDAAVKEPRRTALGCFTRCSARQPSPTTGLAPLQAFSPAELGPLKTMLARRLNSPRTSSAGRLFDAVASLVGLRQQVRYEGQAAMELEFALEGSEPTHEAYELPLRPNPGSRITHHASLLLDWSPMIEAILSDLDHGVPLPLISARFHNALAEAIVCRREANRPAAYRPLRRLLSESLPDRAHRPAPARKRLPPLLAPAHPPQRRRHCPGPDHRRPAPKQFSASRLTHAQIRDKVRSSPTTPTAELPPIGCSVLDVGCWMFPPASSKISSPFGLRTSAFPHAPPLPPRPIPCRLKQQCVWPFQAKSPASAAKTP